MNCEMCGSESGILPVLVEGVELKVCNNCASFGQKLRKPVLKKRFVPQKPEIEIIDVVVENFPAIIKEKREKMGLKQNEFAKYLAERESLIHKMESGSYIPPLDIAKKLERQLNITIIETKEVKSKSLKSESKDLTIGDMIKTK
ncbi:MAG: multiprotein bridging factor aMBF1 [Nanoarchaeota archaeon]